MASSPEELQIQIKTTATGDGATKTADELKKVNAELEKGKQQTSFYAEGMRKAEEAQTAAGQAATTAAGSAGSGIGIAGIAGAAGIAVGGIILLKEALAGLNANAPSLIGNLTGIGGALRGAFQEVLSDKIRSGLSAIFGGDFEARFQKFAEGLGAITPKMSLLSKASADYIAQQRSLTDLIKEQNNQLERQATLRKNLADEALKANKTDQELDEMRRKEEGDRRNRDPRNEFKSAEKMLIDEQDKDVARAKADVAENERRNIQEQEARAAESAAQSHRNVAVATATAAEAMGRGDDRYSEMIPADQRQKIVDARNAVASAATPKDAEKANDDLAKLLKVFEDQRHNAEEVLSKQRETTRHQLQELQEQDRLTDAQRSQRDYERDRTAPLREQERKIADTGDELKGYNQDRGSKEAGLIGNIQEVETDPRFGSLQGAEQAKKALDQIAKRLAAGRETDDDLSNLSAIFSQIGPKLTEVGQQAVAQGSSTLQSLDLIIGMMQTLLKNQAAQKQLLDDLKSQVDSQ